VLYLELRQALHYREVITFWGPIADEDMKTGEKVPVLKREKMPVARGAATQKEARQGGSSGHPQLKQR